ncbi:MAG: VWA domain-containing protein [Candidatus Sericytochromatia bacterium]
MKQKVWIVLLALLAGLLIWRLPFERLAQAWVLLGLVGLLPLALLLYRSEQRQQQRLAAWIAHPLLQRIQPNVHKSNWPRSLCWLLALSCLVIALARPQGPPELSQNQATGLDILLAIDVSDSMKAADLYPNRMQAAVGGIRALLSTLQGDRVSLMVFSGEAFPLSPFTHDYNALEGILDEVSPGLLPSATTDLGLALEQAGERLKRRNAEEAGQVLILFSDGENLRGSYTRQIENLSKAGVRVYTIGTGSKEGSRIPDRQDDWGRPNYKTWQGKEVISQLDENSLRQIAKTGQGEYLPLERLERLPALLNQARNQMPLRTSLINGALVFEERFQAWLLLGLLLFALSQIPAIWESPWLRWRPRAPLTFGHLLRRFLRQPATLSVLMLSFFLQGAFDWSGWRFWQNWQGQNAYEDKNYADAEADFNAGLKADPQDPALLNNQGSARYQDERYEEAAKSFQESAESPEASPEEKARALYNLGNARFRQGQKSDKPQQSWQEAIKAYQQALEHNPRDTQALENLNYVQEQLQQQTPPQQSPSPSPSANQDGQGKGSGAGQPSPNPSAASPNGNSSQGGGGQRDATSPLDNLFSNDKIDEYLKYQEQSERQGRNEGQFQRFKGQRQRQQDWDPFNPDLGEPPEQRDDTLKDW